jgi:hypothetical protein
VFYNQIVLKKIKILNIVSLKELIKNAKLSDMIMDFAEKLKYFGQKVFQEMSLDEKPNIIKKR